jgi:Tfp pilus assembly protein PilF
MRVGTSHLKSGNYPYAIAELEKAYELDEKSAPINNNLALAYLVKEKYSKAEHHLLKALDINEEFSDARNNLGSLYIQTGQSERAVPHLKMVTEDLTYPTPEKAFSNLAIAYMNTKQFGNARDASAKAIKSKRNYCLGHVAYGRSLIGLEDFDKSAQALDRAMSVCQNRSPEANYYSGYSYLKLGKKEKALARFEEVIELFPKSKYAEKSRKLLVTLQ